MGSEDFKRLKTMFITVCGLSSGSVGELLDPVRSDRPSASDVNPRRATNENGNTFQLRAAPKFPGSACMNSTIGLLVLDLDALIVLDVPSALEASAGRGIDSPNLMQRLDVTANSRSARR